jgi:hypothetical protein
VKGKAEAGKTRVKAALGMKEKTPEQRETAGAIAGVQELNRHVGHTIPHTEVSTKFAKIRKNNALASLGPVVLDGRWNVRAVAQRTTTMSSQAAAGAAPSSIPPKRYLPKQFLNAKWMRPKLYFVSGSLHKAINKLAREQAHELLLFMRQFSREDQREQVELMIAHNQLPESARNAFANRTLTPQFVKNVEYDIDHRVSLAEHWVKGGGHLVTDEDRRAHARDLVNLKWVTMASNRGKGSASETGERYEYSDQPWVGPGFTSARESPDHSSIGGIPYGLNPP